LSKKKQQSVLLSRSFYRYKCVRFERSRAVNSYLYCSFNAEGRWNNVYSAWVSKANAPYLSRHFSTLLITFSERAILFIYKYQLRSKNFN